MNYNKLRQALASLFEDCNYITIFNDNTGDELGRIYNEHHGTGKKASYVAMVISTGRRAKVANIEQGEFFIKNPHHAGFATRIEESIGSQLNDVFCLSANFVFQHELQRQKILFKVLLSVCFFLNFCAWGCFFIFHYQAVTNYLENKLKKCLHNQKKVVSLSRDCNEATH